MQIDTQENGFQKWVGWSFVIYSIALVAAVGLIITVTVQDLEGFGSTIALSLGTCSDTYFSAKYADIPLTLKWNFIIAASTIALSLINSVLFLTFVLKKCEPVQSNLILSYVVGVLLCLASGISLGRYLDLLIDKLKMNNCILSGQSKTIISAVALSGLLLLLSLISMIFVLKIWYIFNEEEEKIVKKVGVRSSQNQTQENLIENNPNKQQIMNEVVFHPSYLQNQNKMGKNSRQYISSKANPQPQPYQQPQNKYNSYLLQQHQSLSNNRGIHPSNININMSDTSSIKRRRTLHKENQSNYESSKQSNGQNEYMRYLKAINRTIKGTSSKK